MKKSIIMSAFALIFTIIIILVYKFVIDYSISLQLTEENIRVNMYDNIDLKSYIYKASDSTKKDLKDLVKISVECDDEDIFDGNTLYIKSIGPKVVSYSMEKRKKMITKKLVIKVIIDPNDKGFKPNYDKIESESEPNYDDVPNSGGDTNLSEEQLEYIRSL